MASWRNWQYATGLSPVIRKGVGVRLPPMLHSLIKKELKRLSALDKAFQKEVLILEKKIQLKGDSTINKAYFKEETELSKLLDEFANMKLF